MKEEEPSFPSFLVQQIVVPVIGFLAVALTPEVPRAFTVGMPNPTVENIWATVAATLASFGFALIAHRVAPRLSSDGRWIWAIPLCLLTMCLIIDSVRNGVKSTVADYFNPQAGEAAWVFGLLVIPTYGCLAYSFGVSAAFSRLVARVSSSTNKPQT